jgi:hypothetical protein
VPIAELDYFASRKSDEEAVFEAAMSRIDGRKLSHQNLIPIVVLEEAGRRLRDNVSLLRSAKTFAELQDDVRAIIGPTPGIGDLAVYDISLRIGARFALSPELVYLHRGTRDGAKALGLQWRAKSLPMGELPKGLQVLTPREAEDVLCIYKSYFSSGDSHDLQRTCAPATASGARRC